MSEFERKVLSRLPLAEAVWRLLGYVGEEQFLSELFEQHWGTGSENKVSFPLLVQLVNDALLLHAGSGRKRFRQAREAGHLAATDAAVYGKLRRLPVRLSEALLRESAARLRQVLPAASRDVHGLIGYRVLVVDGKKLKRLPKRLQPLRGVSGKVLGGKVVVGLLLNEGLVVAMHASPDGEANDAPLTPDLIDQWHAQEAGPLLFVADRQFCDLKIPRYIDELGRKFLIRFSKKMGFFPEQEPLRQDSQGRTIREAWGFLGAPNNPRRMSVRQITLEPGDAEDVILITNLRDPAEASAETLLQVYLDRWEIERVFQKVTEVFALEQFIGTSPQGAIFQFAVGTLLYHLMHVVRTFIAEAQAREAIELSSEMIFRDVCDELTAGLLLLPDSAIQTCSQPDALPVELQRRLRELLAVRWSSLWIKCRPKKPPSPRQHIKVRGGHSSAWKLIQQSKARTPPR